MAPNGRLKTFIFTLTTAFLITATVSNEASARRHKKDNNSESNNSQISMEFFPIKRGYDGAQFVVTKEGYLVSLPGLGVAPDATQIAAYRDAQNNIWYIDYKGTAIKLTAEQIQWGMAQIDQQAQARAAASGQPIGQSNEATAPNSTYVSGQQPTQTVIVQQPANQGSSSGGSALATGLAAAGGAAAGAALSGVMYNNNYRGIPYGTPVYHNGGRSYYNGAGGNKVYVNNSGNKYINQWNHQTNWQNTNHGHSTYYSSNSATHYSSTAGRAHVDHHSTTGSSTQHHSRSSAGHSIQRSGGATRSVSRTRTHAGRRR